MQHHWEMQHQLKANLSHSFYIHFNKALVLYNLPCLRPTLVLLLAQHTTLTFPSRSA